MKKRKKRDKGKEEREMHSDHESDLEKILNKYFSLI
jgi:hypothetical protein